MERLTHLTVEGAGVFEKKIQPITPRAIKEQCPNFGEAIVEALNKLAAYEELGGVDFLRQCVSKLAAYEALGELDFLRKCVSTQEMVRAYLPAYKKWIEGE